MPETLDQDVPHLSLYESWDRVQPPSCDIKFAKKLWKWMYRWMCSVLAPLI